MTQTYGPDPELLDAARAFVQSVRAPAGVPRARLRALLAVFGDGTGTIDDGAAVRVPCPWNLEIVQWVLVGDVAGDATVDVQVASYATYPTAASIVGSSAPALGGLAKTRSDPVDPTALFGWTTRLTDGDVIVVSVTGATVAQLTLELRCREVPQPAPPNGGA